MEAAEVVCCGVILNTMFTMKTEKMPISFSHI